MAYKPKKGKFVYNLATVLKVREIFEKREQKLYQERLKSFETEKIKEDEIKAYQNKQIDEMNEKLSAGVIENFASVLQRHAFLGKLKVDVVNQEQKRTEAEILKDEQRERLIQAVKDRKIMDKDKDHKKDKWTHFIKREETKFLDEISTSRHVRKKPAQ